MYTKNKRTLSSKGLLSIAILLVVVAIIFLATTMNSSNNFQLFSLDSISPSSDISAVDNGFAYIESGKLNFLKRKNHSPSWSLPILAKSDKISSSQNFIVVYNESEFELFDKKGKKLSQSNGEFDKNIKEIKCGKHSIAILVAPQKSKPQIYLFSIGKATSDIIELEDVPLDFDFYSDNDFLWALSLNSSVTMPISTITTYASQATTGRIIVEDQLIEKIYFDASNIYVCGTNDLIIYDQTATELSRRKTYGYKVADFATIESKTYFLLFPRLNEEEKKLSSTAKLIETSSDKETVFRISPNNIGAFFVRNRVCFISESSVNKYTLAGNQISTIALEEKGFEASIKVDSSNFLLLNSKSYFLLNLK